MGDALHGSRLAGLLSRLTSPPPRLKAFARSRLRPVQRKLAPLSRPRLVLDEWLIWRLAGQKGQLAPYLEAIARHADGLHGMDDSALARAVATPLRAEQVLEPEMGAARFAIVLEVMRRQTGFALRPNQTECALRLLQGECVELRTGEGKTLAAALAALVAASVGVSVHVVTVNDYLAERDHGLIAPMAAALGLFCAVILQGSSDAEKRAAYDCDIVYATNKTLVFDHLRDLREARAMSSSGQPRRQTGQALAIVDEVDSVLIDDATVPMILSEPAAATPAADLALFRALTEFARNLAPERDRALDRQGNWRLSLGGIDQLERRAKGWLHPAARTTELIDLAETALMAVHGLKEEVAYILLDGQVVLVDQGTGRLMPDRKWSYGLHQMVEIAARSGIVAHVPVLRADFVAAGDALVQIDTTLAEADLRVAGITVAALEERLSRNEGLLERNLISRDEIGTLRAELELARAEQARAATHIARATIRAPFAGYITELGVAEGEMIGMEPLLRLIEVSLLRAEMVYRADAFGAIRTGDEITLHAELSAETITARVTAIDRFIDAASNTFTVAGEIDNRDLALVSGTACHVPGPASYISALRLCSASAGGLSR
ncbi:MAG: efflux RND transporter periplasmic adaptor subunit [Roseinatronobacter sp.]|nr:efflux RND transporter periplasmic adaptor subunit [Roseinatronobacter sp.]